ncbi:SusC/RagA family TonB-linked outer membrane protein [uncultured Chitinophaga sp.]|uniref:SusC/RagA family TonB-linked outer membrane protein n=1 Tax=uncultured Chitinophaga sp. TaxID=339340 RepID=UPI0025EDA482|nr:SusC/RagA family TonB-linked outer membrane protein [uncultured Chitinophaga sp.]
MKLTMMLLLVFLFTAYGKGKAQQVTLSGKNLSLQQVFTAVEKQTGYVIVANEGIFAGTHPVTLNVAAMPLNTLLDKVLKDQYIKYVIQGKTIFLSQQPAPVTTAPAEAVPPIQVYGRVIDSLGSPLEGASVQVKGKGRGVLTDKSGWFSIQAQEGDKIIVSFVGYNKMEFVADARPGETTVMLRIVQTGIGEVSIVSNGYQQLPKERATGSFTHITREMINRSPGPDILSRLEGITNGLLFNRTNAEGEEVAAFQLESRGRATILSESSPLIVVDNFPFEGNIRDINPNDVESVTILKDAAAASIWGARAGNGVIVITTRQGSYNRKTQVSFSFNTAFADKPDLFYDRRFMPSPMVMQIQKEKFLRGDWQMNEEGMFSFSPYVELLIKQRDGVISEEQFLEAEQKMQRTDIRNDALKYLYQPSLQQQYALSINGGSNVNKYFFSVGYDKTRSSMVGDDDRRLTLNVQNAFKPVSALEINTRISYSAGDANRNAFTITDLSNASSGLQPYMSLVDEHGNPAKIEYQIRSAIVDSAEKNGLLPWYYNPLEEVRMADNTAKNSFLNLLGNVRYQVVTGVNIDATYQYTEQKSSTRYLYNKETFFVRHLVNNYTQADGTRPIPYGGILRLGSPAQLVQHSGRVQLTAQKEIGEHELAFLAGGEVRQAVEQSFPETLLYNYDADLGVGTSKMDYVKTYKLYTSWGGATIPGASDNSYYKIDRYLSYFANGSYTFRSKYILSGSARWDGSNLFGVKTNQKGTLLWSAGASWNVFSESFLKAGWIDQLRLRGTYGSSGNVNKSVSTFPVIDYSVARFLHPDLEPYAGLTSPGNPSLRWEQVKTMNFGVDWAVLKGRISGSLEFFSKKANDLIGDAFLPPSTGVNTENNHISQYRYNYAALNTKGIDLQVTTKNLEGPVKWQTTWLFNYAADKVKEYYNSETLNGNAYVGYLGYQIPLEVGRSVSGIYAYPWHGLNPDDGRVLIYKDGQKSTDYAGYLASLRPEDMVYAGVTNPPYYGSVLNNVEWKRLQLSVLLSWKAGYVYRRSSGFPGMEYTGTGVFHADLEKKWKQPGDEKNTNVPAGGNISGYDQSESSIYLSSQALIAKGDHIAMQDVSLNYSIPTGKKTPSLLKSARVYMYVRNLGFLWKADRNNVDPTTPNARYPQPMQFNTGIQLSL